MGLIFACLLSLFVGDISSHSCLNCGGSLSMSCEVVESGLCPYIGSLYLLAWGILLIPGVPFEMLFGNDSLHWHLVGYGLIGLLISFFLFKFKNRKR